MLYKCYLARYFSHHSAPHLSVPYINPSSSPFHFHTQNSNFSALNPKNLNSSLSMASTLASSVISKTKFIDTHKSSFYGVPISSQARLKIVKSTPQNIAVSMSADASPPPYDLGSFSFNPIKESIVAREMTRRYMTDMITYADTDVVIVGAGSAGLSCAYELSKNPDVQV